VLRVLAALAAVGAVMCSVVAVGIWLLVRDSPSAYPKISAYSDGNLVRVGPRMYCDVVELNDCQYPGTVGRLPVTSRDRVQLSVPAEVGRAPWILRRLYEDLAEETDRFVPGDRRAVTIRTSEPEHGRLIGMTVQLPALVTLPGGEPLDAWHAEWAVEMVWPN
jgi:hypothetical protein